MQLLRCTIGGRPVFVEHETPLERLAPDAEPETLACDMVYRFSQDLARLSQGVTGVALINDTCLPIVSCEYFRPDRSPKCGVRTIDRSPAVDAVATGARRFFVFGVPGALGFRFALSMNQVLEVSPALPMASLNFEHSHLAGAAVWRGGTIPVVDLAFAAKLGAIGQDTAWGRMMVVRNCANRIFAIPAAGQVRQHAVAAQVYAPDSVSLRPMRGIRGVFRFEGSPLLVPDLDALAD